MNDYMTLLHKHKINGGFLAPDRIPMEERNKNEMILELQNEVHIKDKEIERLNKKLEDLEKLNNANYQSFIETNKIMIELEKWIKEILLSKAYSIGYKEAYKDIYMKLQELKGSE